MFYERDIVYIVDTLNLYLAFGSHFPHKVHSPCCAEGSTYFFSSLPMRLTRRGHKFSFANNVLATTTTFAICCMRKY